MIDIIYTMKELENWIVKSTIATMTKGCYQCINFDKVDNPSPLHAYINFISDKTVRLCTYHFSQFNQKRK